MSPKHRADLVLLRLTNPKAAQWYELGVALETEKIEWWGPDQFPDNMETPDCIAQWLDPAAGITPADPPTRESDILGLYFAAWSYDDDQG